MFLRALRIGNKGSSSVEAVGSRSKAGWKWVKSRSAKRVFTFCRWLHVYLSTVFLGLLIFFCVTGIFLNHVSWFASDGGVENRSEALPGDLTEAFKSSQSPPVDRLLSLVKERYGLEHPRKVEIDMELGELTLDYPLPAGYAFVTVVVEESLMEVEVQKGTMVAILNDLHKGRHTGRAWSWVLDGSALGIMLVSVTGFIILFQQAKWRRSGLAAAATGVLTPWLIYLLWVPRVVW